MKIAGRDKIKGRKVDAEMSQRAAPGRFGNDATAAVLSRRERRTLEQAQGLVPFAVKLDGDLVKQLHALAQARPCGLNELVAELLQKGLAAQTA